MTLFSRYQRRRDQIREPIDVLSQARKHADYDRKSVTSIAFGPSLLGDVVVEKLPPRNRSTGAKRSAAGSCLSGRICTTFPARNAGVVMSKSGATSS